MRLFEHLHRAALCVASLVFWASCSAQSPRSSAFDALHAPNAVVMRLSRG
jgi:hypothetical protein